MKLYRVLDAFRKYVCVQFAGNEQQAIQKALSYGWGAIYAEEMGVK